MTRRSLKSAAGWRHTFAVRLAVSFLFPAVFGGGLLLLALAVSRGPAAVAHAAGEAAPFEWVVAHTLDLAQDRWVVDAETDAARPTAAFVVPPPRDSLRPAIAIIIDDLGLSRARTRRVIALPQRITLSFLPYGDHVQTLASEAAARGHEIFLHLPMEPEGDSDPGPDALMGALASTSLMARASAALDSFAGYTGVNNHMGSALTTDVGLMAEVMSVVAARDVVFVDSLTSPNSVAYDLARAHGIGAAKRDVFIDHDQGADEMEQQLAQAVAIARAHGTAIAIAHPHGVTMDVLGPWLEGLAAQGVDVVPVSEVIRRREAERMLFAAR